MKFFVIVLGLLSGILLQAQESIDKEYKIYDTRRQQIISLSQIVADMQTADVLFFGEEHNDSIAHYLQHSLLTALHTAFGNKIALSLEMFETDNQLVLNDYLTGKIDEKRLGTDARLWSNYKDYRPMIEYAKENSLPVIAANPPRRYVSLVTRRGTKALDSLSKEAKKLLPPLPFDTLSGRYREKFMDIMKGAPESSSRNVYYSQNLWDAGMAHSIYSFWKKNKGKKILHCVGRFHSDEQLGTMAQLKKKSKKIKALNISSFSDASFENPDWSNFTHLGDYIIITNPEVKRSY